MLYTIIYLCCTTLSFFYVTILNADETDTVLSGAMKCTKEELMTFFPQQVVQSVLLKAKFPPEQASSIAEKLSHADQELNRLVEEKVSQLNPNGFKDFNRRNLSIKIYRETLYEVFAKVLKAHGITNEDQIQSLLDDLQAAKSKLFIECIRNQQAHENF